MFKPKKQISHHKPSSRHTPHSNRGRNPHKYAEGHPSYGHGFHEHKEHPSNQGQHEQDFHEHEACQHCPYKRGFYAHFHQEHNKHAFHEHPHSGRHPDSDKPLEAKRLDDGSLQCLSCPNGCIMIVSEDGSITGNHCPRGAEAARRIKE